MDRSVNITRQKTAPPRISEPGANLPARESLSQVTKHRFNTPEVSPLVLEVGDCHFVS